MCVVVHTAHDRRRKGGVRLLCGLGEARKKEEERKIESERHGGQ